MGQLYAPICLLECHREVKQPEADECGRVPIRRFLGGPWNVHYSRTRQTFGGIMPCSFLPGQSFLYCFDFTRVVR